MVCKLSNGRVECGVGSGGNGRLPTKQTGAGVNGSFECHGITLNGGAGLVPAQSGATTRVARTSGVNPLKS